MAEGNRRSSHRTSKKFTFEWNVSDFESAMFFAQNRTLESPLYSYSIDRSLVGSWCRQPNLFGLPTTETPPGSGPVSVAWNVSVSDDMTFYLKLSTQSAPFSSPHPANPNGGKQEKWSVGSLNVKFVVSLLDWSERVQASKETMGVLSYGGLYVRFLESCSRKLTERDLAARRKLLVFGNLNTRCEVIVYGEVVHAPEHKLTLPLQTKDLFSKLNIKPTHSLQSGTTFNLGYRLETLRQEEFLTDFTLVVGEEEHKVHKVVLAAHSPVFKRMIETDMKEKRECRSVIRDISVEAMEELLTYMYTGEAPNLKERKEELFEAADKYEMQHLKALCEEALGSSITATNAVKTLILADRHSASQLRSVCKGFIAGNMSKVKETEEWHRLKEEFQQLYIELLETQLPPRNIGIPGGHWRLMPPPTF